MTPIIVIAGPTASGKSQIALSLAKRFQGYIINADSKQIYKEINIGSAKPKFEKDNLIDNVPHFLYDILPVSQRYDIYSYQKDVKQVLKNNSGNPILTGGTGLYIDSVVFNYKLPTLLEAEITKEELLQRVRLNESDINNPRRIEAWVRKADLPTKGEPLDHIYFVIDVDKEELNRRIEERVERMFKEGLVEENTKLWQKYKTYLLPGLYTIGYKEFEEYFNNICTLEDVKQRIISNTKKYAKRQRTWFKRNKSAIWVKDISEIYDVIGKRFKDL